MALATFGTEGDRQLRCHVRGTDVTAPAGQSCGSSGVIGVRRGRVQSTGASPQRVTELAPTCRDHGVTLADAVVAVGTGSALWNEELVSDGHAELASRRVAGSWVADLAGLVDMLRVRLRDTVTEETGGKVKCQGFLTRRMSVARPTADDRQARRAPVLHVGQLTAAERDPIGKGLRRVARSASLVGGSGGDDPEPLADVAGGAGDARVGDAFLRYRVTPAAASQQEGEQGDDRRRLGPETNLASA
jgi:hypothetical protein